MKATRIASRYAKSLLILSVERGELERTYSDMKLVADVCDANNLLALLLKSPIVKSDKKIEILDEIFSDRISEISKSFLNIITNKGRENHLQSIALEFLQQYKREKKIITAVVTSAAGIDDNIRKKILNIVKNNLKSEVELIEKENKDLIGGIVIRIGDKQFDASIKNKLNDLKRTFTQKYFIEN